MQLPPRPESDPDRMSNWHGPDEVDDKTRGKPPRAPLPGEKLEIRYTSVH